MNLQGSYHRMMASAQQRKCVVRRTQEVVDRLLVRIKSAIFTPQPLVLLFSSAIQDPQGDLEKHPIFKPVSKAEKLRKPAPRASKKH